ncbi:MAG TPA: TlpA disulfide reductase family protein [Chitinophagaceae bacterium]|nr:TlpA disulfide reductase family protein [Chitinophagaceae bacterium]
MTLKRLLILFLFIPLIGFSQTGANSFTINGKLTGYDEGTSIKLVANGATTDLAVGKLQKGSFVLKGSLAEPILCFLIIGDNTPVEIYVENSTMTFIGDKKQPEKPIFNGSASHLDFKEFTGAILPILGQLNSLASTINSMVPGPDRDGLLKIYYATQENIQKEIDKFINAKPSSVVAPFVLQATSQFYDNPLLLEKRFLSLSPDVRKMTEAKKLESFINLAKIGAVGTQSLDFSQPDTIGKPVSLSSFHGKYVLVDFWASWCGPCRNENPNVVSNYQRFKNKNFTVLGISLDKPGQKDKWIKAIHEDSLTWTHVSDLQYWSNEAAKLYHVAQIPRNFLIDPNGKIIGKDLRGPALEAKLCELLGCN